MELHIKALFVIAVLNGVFSYFIVRGGKGALRTSFSLFVLAVGAWSLGLAFFMETENLDFALRYSILYYIAPAAVVLTFLCFSLFFLREKIKKSICVYIAFPFLLLVAGFIFDKNLIIEEVYFVDGLQKGVVLNKLNYIYYLIYILVYVVASYYVLFKARITNKLKRTQLNFIITGTSISYVFAMIFNLFLPYIGNYSLIWLGPPFTIIMIGVMAYVILRHHLFNLKLVVVEFFVFLLWLVISVELFLANTAQEIITSAAVLIFVVVLGILLIRTVYDEINRREEMEIMVIKLEDANERLKKIDQEKSDFVSIASHQLRTPLTAIKGYSSMLLEGSYGRISAKSKIAIDKIFQSSQRLVYIVNDMLDVSRIEKGKLKYNFEDVNIVNLVKDVHEELKVNAKSKNLEFTVDVDGKDDIVVSIDPEKFRQAIVNLVDNAIKYTNSGFVNIFIEKDDEGGKMMLSIKDSGIGMDKTSIKVVFEKFERAENAKKSHTEGSGLGLYVAKEIIKANNGIIWVTSDGIDKGSQFYVELPIKNS